MTAWRTRLKRGGVAVPMALLGVAYAVLVLPQASNYTMRVLAIAGIYALLATGYRFIFGLAGALSLAQGTFMGLGAYISGILATRYGIPFDLALPASIGGPVGVALLVAIPVLRLQTHYFALATLLIGQVALLAATQWQSVTGGANGIGGVPPLSLLGYPITSRLGALLLVWSAVSAGALLAWQAGRGRLGDAFAVLRADPAAARAIGIDTGLLRLTAFLLSAAYAGLAGSLYVHALGVLSPDVLGFPVMVTCLTIAVVGSRLRVAGGAGGRRRHHGAAGMGPLPARRLPARLRLHPAACDSGGAGRADGSGRPAATPRMAGATRAAARGCAGQPARAASSGRAAASHRAVPQLRRRARLGRRVARPATR